MTVLTSCSEPFVRENRAVKNTKTTKARTP